MSDKSNIRTKADLYAMLAEAVRNTQPQPQLATSAENIPIELQAALISLRHLLGSDAMTAWIETRVCDAVFRDRHFNGDATAFAQSLLIELRPMLSGDQVRRAARVRSNKAHGSPIQSR